MVKIADKEIIERVREDIKLILERMISFSKLGVKVPFNEYAIQILSHKNIAIIDPDAELPENPFPFMGVRLGVPRVDRRRRTRYCDYKVAQDTMLQRDWVKRVK